MDKPKFSASEWYKIRERGMVAIIKHDENPPCNPIIYINQQVYIDDKIYTVLGVEAFGMGRSQPILPLGLLVSFEEYETNTHQRGIK